MKNDFEERKNRKIERYQALALKNQKISDQQFERAHDLASVIPFGQPILIGHHSEKRDRSYRSKINSIQDKAMEASSKAKYYEEKAAIAESNTAISSDDPGAIVKLSDKLLAMQELQELMKAANKIIKNKKLSDPDKISKLAEHNIKESLAVKLLLPDFCNRVGFPDYRLTNNNANINRVKKRIEMLKQVNAMQSTEIAINGVKILKNTEANRIQIVFPGKPSFDVLRNLKQHGFRWSPTEGAWQRQISNQAEYWAKHIVSSISNATSDLGHDVDSFTTDNGPTGHGDICFSDADSGL